MTEFIVAEISKNWIDARELVQSGTLCEQFERCIEVNRERGYLLHSFQIHRLMATKEQMNETIIAVFRAWRPTGGPSSARLQNAATAVAQWLEQRAEHYLRLGSQSVARSLSLQAGVLREAIQATPTPAGGPGEDGR